MKRALKILGVIVAVLAVAAGIFWFVVFGNNKPIVDGEKLAPGIEIIKDGFVSVAMIDVAPHQVVLIDAGNDEHATAIRKALARRGLNPTSVVGIFLTHGHPDHMNGARNFPDAKIFALATEVPLIGKTLHVNYALRNGAVVDVGAGHFEVLPVPGHTPGSAAILTNGVLFLGDSAGANSASDMTYAVRLFTKDHAQNVASLKALAELLARRRGEIKVLAFAHTGPIRDFGALEEFAQRN